MQITEKFRRGVLVPLDDAADDALAADDIGDSTRVWFFGIDDQDAFEVLWDTGIFATINRETGSLVDEYEEAAIPVAMVPKLRQVVEAYAAERTGGATGARFFSALIAACDVAEAHAKPIYFIL